MQWKKRQSSSVEREKGTAEIKAGFVGRHKEDRGRRGRL
jgi:hypothetical protein